MASATFSKALADRGYAVLRFDFTGLGESEGEFAHTNFASNLDDLVAAADYLASEYEAPKLLIGHSLGGAAVIHVARRIESSKAVVTIGAPYDPEHVAHLIQDSVETIQAEGEAMVNVGGRPFRVQRHFLETLKRDNLGETVRALRRALLVMHSPVDTVVDVANAAELFQVARHPKSFVSLDQADHLLRRSADAKYAGRVAAAWAHKYVASGA